MTRRPDTAVAPANAHNAYGEGCGNLDCDACAGLELPTTPRGAAMRRAARETLAIARLEHFIRYAWHLIEPAETLIWNFHLTIICEELEAVTRADEQEVVFNVPPGMMKSLTVAVFWTAWNLLRDPSWSVIALSNDDQLAIRDSRRAREIVRSEEYRRLIRRAELAAGRDPSDPWTLAEDQDTKHHWATTRMGFRQSLSIHASIIGKRARGLLLDDPYDVKQAVLGSPLQVKERMDEVITIYDTVLPTRVNDVRRGFRVLIMQRINLGDLAGVLASRGVRVVAFQIEYDPDWPWNHPKDPRTVRGEPLFPIKFPPAYVAKLRASLGARQAAAQLDQNPVPDEGALFSRKWFEQRYKARPQDLPVDEILLSVDCAFKDKATNDRVALQVWGRRDARYYLLDLVVGHLGLRATIVAILDLLALWPRCHGTLIEDKANGPGVLDVIQGRVPNAFGYNPEASKYARAQVAALACESSQVFLPHPETNPQLAAKVAAFVEECVGFGAGGVYADQVDAFSQVVIRWTRAGNEDAVARIEREFGGIGEY